MYNIIIQYNNDIGYYIYLHNKKKDGKIMDIMPNNSINILSGKEEEINEKIKENARIARLEAKENAYLILCHLYLQYSMMITIQNTGNNIRSQRIVINIHIGDCSIEQSQFYFFSFFAYYFISKT